MESCVLPVVYSALASSALATQVLAYYRIEPITSCQFWHRGLSDVYLIETQTQQYILRVAHAHWRSKSDIDFELELLDFLRQRAIPVAAPLKTQAGCLSMAIEAPEGRRYAALFTYAPGTVAIGDLNQTQSYDLGKTVANLHQAAQGFRSEADRPPLTLAYLLDDSFAAIAPFLQQKPADLTYLVTAIAEIQAQLQDFSQEPPFWGICWGDAHSGNVHFTADNQITLFDFDQCGYGWRVFEIAKFLQVALNTGLSIKVRQAFIDGYQSVAALTDAEIAALPAFTQTAHIWAWAICLSNAMLHNYSRLDASYFHQRLEHLKLLRCPDCQLF